jgi:hypothetical protein
MGTRITGTGVITLGSLTDTRGGVMIRSIAIILASFVVAAGCGSGTRISGTLDGTELELNTAESYVWFMDDDQGKYFYLLGVYISTTLDGGCAGSAILPDGHNCAFLDFVFIYPPLALGQFAIGPNSGVELWYFGNNCDENTKYYYATSGYYEINDITLDDNDLPKRIKGNLRIIFGDSGKLEGTFDAENCPELNSTVSY